MIVLQAEISEFSLIKLYYDESRGTVFNIYLLFLKQNSQIPERRERSPVKMLIDAASRYSLFIIWTSDRISEMIL